MRKPAAGIVILALMSFAPRSAAARAIEFVIRENVLPPMAHTIFCGHFPHECVVSKASSSFLISDFHFLYAELALVNRLVNSAILPDPAKISSGFGNLWLLFPSAGNCTDYAVSKRHDLIARGGPSSALLLAEVVLSSGEHHLILLANAGARTYVLDNLNPDVVALDSSIGYRCIRIESPETPRYWSRVSC